MLIKDSIKLTEKQKEEARKKHEARKKRREESRKKRAKIKEIENRMLARSFGNTLLQNEKGIYSIKGEKYTLNGKVYFFKITIIKDKLDLFEPVYSIKYYDFIFKELKTVENKTFDELINYLQEQKLFIGDNRTIKRIIETIIQHGYDNSIIEIETKVFKEGYFIKEDKVLENTLITDTNPTNNDIAEAIKLVNDIIKNRDSAIANDCTLFRFMLWAPFSWCLKEIGYNKDLYSLILVGAPKTSKTGSCLNFSWLYSKPSDREKSVTTTSVFGSRLEDSTLPAIIDEAYGLISKPDMEDPMKRCIYQKDSRSTKDRNNNKITDEFKALGLPIFILNEYYEVKDFIKRRYHINHYTSDMIVSDDDMKDFEKKYSPESDNSPLIQLRCLGKAFADKFIPYIEEKSDELFDLEELTIKILKEISEEVGEEFIKEIYEIQETSDNFDVDIADKIRNGLNALFRKNHQKLVYCDTHYHYDDFISCADNKEISWLYRRSNGNFAINKAGFEKEVSEIAGRNMGYMDILSELNIPIINGKDETKNQITVMGDKHSIRGFEIGIDDLIFKMFNIHIPKKESDSS